MRYTLGIPIDGGDGRIANYGLLDRTGFGIGIGAGTEMQRLGAPDGRGADIVVGFKGGLTGTVGGWYCAAAGRVGWDVGEIRGHGTG